MALKKTSRRRDVKSRRRIRVPRAKKPNLLEGLESRVLLSSIPVTVLTQSIPLTGQQNGGGKYATSLVMDASGNIFGATESGGINNYGTIFEIAAGTNSVVTLASFNGADGFTPEGNLVLEGNTLYGATANGGAYGRGSIFSFDLTTHAITSLASFTGTIGGAAPTNGIVSDGQGNFFGTTYGALLQNATIFEYSTSTGLLQTLVSLPIDQHIDTGVAVDAGTGLVEISTASGTPTIFTTTTTAGAQSRGSIISYALNSGATTVHTIVSFDATHGSGPLGSLLYVTNADAAGDPGLVGATSGGGAQGLGAVFDAPLTISNGTYTSKLSLLGSFNGADGARPEGKLLLVDSSNAPTDSLLGNTLYGGAAVGGGNGNGAIYKIANAAPTTNGAIIPRFTNSAFTMKNGEHPSGGLLLGSDGTIYGTTATWGEFKQGSIFVLSPSAPAPATHLVFATLPTKAVAGTSLGTVVVKVENASGHVVAGDTSNVTLEVATGLGTFTPITVAAVNGVATFTGMTLTTAGNYTLLATDDTAHATSKPLTVTAAAAAMLAIAQQSTQGTTTAKLAPLVVDVEDQFGNVVTTDKSKVTLSVATGTAGALTGTLTVAAKKGVATFKNALLNAVGTYTLAAADGTLAGAATGSIAIGLPATHLAISITPVTIATGEAFSVQVTLLDADGNVATTDTSAVKLTLAAHPAQGKLFGPVTATAVNGIVTFTPMTLYVAGTYALRATDGKFSITSSPFVVGTPI